MSLRWKLVLALVLSGLAVVLAVGGVAHYELQQKFASLQAKQAKQSFRASVAAYLAEHGRWPDDPDMSGFFDFIAAREAAGQAAGVSAPASAPVPLRRFSLPRPMRGQAGPPPGPRPAGADGAPPALPGPQAEPGGGPGFRFILTDADYRVLLGAGQYREGEILPQDAREPAEPVEVNGRVLAYVSTEGVLTPGPEDEVYLNIMLQALIFGGFGAVGLVALLGLLLGQGLSADLRRLTRAVRAMSSGDLRQRVALSGGGEVRSLARAFNAMSEALASSDESLRALHETISQQAEQLKELSIRDPLTGLYNRRHFDEHLQQLYEQSRRHGQALTVVVADIDWFKRINDDYSHAVGDAVLRQVAELLRGHLRASDLLARWGGEEFVLALPQTALPAALGLCEKLRQLIEQHPWERTAAGLRVTLSMGLHDDQQVGSAAAMLDRADAQLYRAKEGGRNRVCCARDAAPAGFTVP